MSNSIWRSTSRAIACGAAVAGLLAIPGVASAQRTQNQFTLSGDIGSTFGNDANVDQPGMGFGGSVSYLANGWLGGEFLAGFSPNMNLDLVSGLDSQVNDYMFNVIAAAPIGTRRRIQPFVSGGAGALTLHQSPIGVSDPNDAEPGVNIGGGVMGFDRHWGFRTDLRHFSQVGSATQPAPGVGIPEGFNFWRANAGVAYRW